MFSVSVPVALAALAASAHAQITGTFPATPLASISGLSYPSGIPYKIEPDTQLARGPQLGYNLCNSTTEGPKSLCQTSVVNSIDDFCLWAPPEPNSTVADLEGEMISWCTKPGHGTRLMPQGTLYAVQWINAPDFVMITGFMRQELINMNPDDFGGEMDPHGQDLRGNPMGGLMFSTHFTGQYEQVTEWNNFMGSNQFCFKACNPAGSNPAGWCRNTLDRLGCAYNAPAVTQNGTFVVCDGDDGQLPGVYTTNGVAVTYTQPPEDLGPITSVPYTPTPIASSNCVTHASTDLYTALPSPTLPLSSSSASGPAATGHASGSATRSGAAAGASSTGGTSGAETLAISSMSILGVVFASLFLA